jgi:hypothetical protein
VKPLKKALAAIIDVLVPSWDSFLAMVAMEVLLVHLLKGTGWETVAAILGGTLVLFTWRKIDDKQRSEGPPEDI